MSQEKAPRLSKEDWLAKKKVERKDKVRLKYTTPKQRSRRIWILECRLEEHVVGLAKSKRKYERLTQKAKLEIEAITEVDFDEASD